MKVYSRTDIMGISFPDGHKHSRSNAELKAIAEGAPKAPFEVNCDRVHADGRKCHEVLMADHGYKQRPEQVEKTPDEILDEQKVSEAGVKVGQDLARLLSGLSSGKMKLVEA